MNTKNNLFKVSLCFMAYVICCFTAFSYELQVINPVDTTIIFQGAGYIPNNAVTIWDGTEASTATSYVCKLSLKNNYGKRLTRNFAVTVQ
ncbi:MAG: hypothetical protein J6R12_04425 [Bacteroidales bacterium]|nr:hypothetical protein [Bacteroidales bacterium]